MENQLKTIIIDGKEYDLSMFSNHVQQMTQIIVHWETQLRDQRLEVAKTEAALREANREIVERVNAELANTQNESEQPAT